MRTIRFFFSVCKDFLKNKSLIISFDLLSKFVAKNKQPNQNPKHRDFSSTVMCVDFAVYFSSTVPQHTTVRVRRLGDYARKLIFQTITSLRNILVWIVIYMAMYVILRHTGEIRIFIIYYCFIQLICCLDRAHTVFSYKTLPLQTCALRTACVLWFRVCSVCS